MRTDPSTARVTANGTVGTTYDVLVVDDSNFFCTILRRCFSEHGFNVRTASTGREALELIRHWRPDSIVLDISMPEMDGFAVCEALKANPLTSEIPVLFLTGDSKTEQKVRGFEVGGMDYVTKDAPRAEIVARVRTHARLARLQRDLRNSRDELAAHLKQMEEFVRKERELNRTIQAQHVELLHTGRMAYIGHLAGGLAHEINTPSQYVSDNLRFIAGSVNDLLKLISTYRTIIAEGQLGSRTDAATAKGRHAEQEADLAFLEVEIPKAVEQGLSGVERINVIVTAMKEFAHDETRDKTLVDLNRMIEATITVTRSEWEPVAEMVTDLALELPLVPCLPAEFNQATRNILSNAACAIRNVSGDGTGRKGTITLTTRHEGDWIEFRVSDTGTGIPPEVQPAIFAPFFTTKEVGKGTGQGLAIAHTIIVRKHGGTITFETEVGRGTTFIIRLPLESRADKQAGTPCHEEAHSLR